MGLLDRFRGNRDKNNASVANQYSYNGAKSGVISSFFGNREVDEDQIMSIPAVQDAVNAITSRVSSLPVKLYKNVDQKVGKEPVDDYRVDLINNNPNENMDGVNFKKKIIKDLVLYGTSKTYIERSPDGSIISLYPLNTKDLSITVYSENGYQFYAIDTLNSNVGMTDFYDELLLSVLDDSEDGITGRGAIQGNDKTFKLALSMNEYELGLMQNGAVPSGVLETDQKINNSKVIDDLKKTFSDYYSGTKNAGKTLILEQGFSYKNIGFDPNSLQLTESKKSIISDIASIFNIPEAMINASANKYDSAEQNNIDFLQKNLYPKLRSFEAALNKTILTADEQKQGYEFKFDISNLTMITTQEKQEGVINLFKNGLITNLKGQRELGMVIDPDDREYYSLTTGTVMRELDTGFVVNPNTGEIIDMNNQKIISTGFDNKGSGDGITKTASDSENNNESEDEDEGKD